jgi:NTE family protein
MKWANKLSTKENRITPYFIDLDATDIQNPEDRIFFNQVPTSFSLEKEQADKLIELAKDMLRQNPEYQKLLHQLGANL